MFPALSKRAARRLIQRAFVLVGRDRNIRQHIREAELTTLWVLEDWGLEWTVALHRGKIEFHRGRVGKPRLTFTWQAAEQFFNQIETEAPAQDGFQCVGDPAVRKFSEPVYVALSRYLREILRNPVDDDGERIA